MFRSLFNRKEAFELPEIENLTIGRTFSLDRVEMKLMSKDALFVAPENDLRVVAQGLCDLGEQSFLHRFYPDDDRYLLQLQGGDGRTDTRIDETVVWYVYDVKYVSRDAEWREIASAIRKASIALETQAEPVMFERAWFNHSDADEEPMTYWETVHEARDKEEGAKIYQSAMLFGRGLADGTDEMLLVNMEEPEGGDRAVSYLVGRALGPHSLLT